MRYATNGTSFFSVFVILPRIIFYSLDHEFSLSSNWGHFWDKQAWNEGGPKILIKGIVQVVAIISSMDYNTVVVDIHSHIDNAITPYA